MIGFRVEQKLKDLFEQEAEKENRNLSSFIVNAVLTYIKEHHGIDWHEIKAQESKKKPVKKSKK
jgi:hypothetical protein